MWKRIMALKYNARILSYMAYVISVKNYKKISAYDKYLDE
jgi:hypothetical protein